MRCLLDTNVVLDVLLKREPWADDVSRLWQANDEGRIVAHIAASSLTDIFYVARRIVGLPAAHAAVQLCLTAFEICPVERQTLEAAVTLSGSDFEDNLQIACASQMHLDAIVTRDPQDFKYSPIRALTPAEALAQLDQIPPAIATDAGPAGEQA
jgi:predicted nucleic acid-binding protein